MLKLSESILKITGLTVALILTVILLTGCGRFDSPTASQPSVSEANDLWNPKPGDQVVPGHDVPILDPGYWESENGQVINPAMIQLGAAAIIGPEGGKLKLGKHTLDVPRGAVNEPVAFTLNYASTTTVALDCGPSPFRFNVPVTLTMSYAGTQYETGNTASELNVYYMIDPTTLEEMPSTVNVSGKIVTAQIDHFSRYIIS